MEHTPTDISVLIAEDNPIVLHELQRYVADCGYSCVSAQSLKEAYTLLERSTFDLIVSDLFLHDGTGFDLIGYLAEKKITSNTIVLTANPSAESVISALKLGAYDFIKKPVNRESFIFALKRAAENIQLKKENERAFNELVKLNHLKNEFLTVVSHDLRSPLSSIAGYVNYLVKKGNLSDIQHRYLNVIRDITNDLYSLVNELLDISKIETGIIELNKAPTDIVELTNMCINSFILLGMDKNTRIDFFNHIDNPIVHIDRMKIMQVLNNIISNSIKFTENGTITVSAERKGPKAVISIADTGTGMTESQLERIFDQYSYMPARGTRGERGNGLGLVICKRFIDLHQGEIRITSIPGNGTTFHISLPAE